MERDYLDRMARLAYGAYLEAKSWDLNTDKLVDWHNLQPECRNAWRNACSLAEGIDDPPEAAKASWPNSYDM